MFEALPKSKENIYIEIDEIVGGSFFVVDRYCENKKTEKNIILLCPSLNISNKIYDILINFIPKQDIVLFLENESVRINYISEGKDIIANRIFALSSLIEAKNKIFILTPSSYYRYYPKKEEFLLSVIKVKKGDNIDISKLENQLSLIGYLRVAKIDQSLQYAKRGDIIDVFSINYDKPIRIEFFDDLIESIRFFDIGTQLSNSETNEITIFPANTLIFNNKEKSQIQNKISKILSNDLTRIEENQKDYFKNNILNDIEKLNKNNVSSSNYKYYGFLKEDPVSITTYLSNFETIIINQEQFLNKKNNLVNESNSFLADLCLRYKSISGLTLFNENIDIVSKNSSKNYFLSSLFIDKTEKIVIPLNSPKISNKNNLDFSKIIDFYINEFNKILILVKNKMYLNKVLDYLEYRKIDYCILDSLKDKLTNKVNIMISSTFMSIEDKKDSFAIIDSNILFNSVFSNYKYTSKFREGVILNSYEELEENDYVVHETYGIGKYLGIKELEINDKKEDYLEITFLNNDELFVPLYSFNLIRKYSGNEGKIPKLSSLHSEAWKKQKQRIKEKINELADKLLELYRDRTKIEGFVFNQDDLKQKEFEDFFEHELTFDQEKSLEEIKKDMESNVLMDRLLCGDVGFGKTEIAFRAAYKAILSKKQVLMIAPTTLLAKQHFEVAKSRFINTNVKISLLTRNETNKDVQNILEKTKSGDINFIIGTHKALSDKLIFNNLGLLIIDEEQRFGVEQKEKNKIKYKNIDVLTLSATPIPRTLQSSLTGLKSISTIQTPPKERLPIELYLIEKDYKVLKEIIEREISRGGQIYYVHNDISTMEEVYIKLKELLPKLKIEIIHGKMNKESINKAMTLFYLNEVDLLLSTTIIENGIDVRNANLIIVDNADRYGLSQLYQIKGRVGRGDKVSYCYLLVDKAKKINEDAKKRLKAIQDFTELGSGYKIAQRDLLIRGAGEILGKEQAGFIDDLGIDLYIKLLNEAIKNKEKGQIPVEKEEKNKRIIIPKPLFIPKEYASNSEKLELYQKLISINNVNDLEKFQNECKDQYGNIILPSLRNLIEQRKIDIYLSFEEFSEVKETNDNIYLTLSQTFSNIEGIGQEIFIALISYSSTLKFKYEDKKIKLVFLKNRSKDYIETFLNMIIKIHEVKLKHETR